MQTADFHNNGERIVDDFQLELVHQDLAVAHDESNQRDDVEHRPHGRSTHSGARIGEASFCPPPLTPLKAARSSSERETTCGGGLSTQPPKNDAMEHQREWDSERWYHHQRVG